MDELHRLPWPQLFGCSQFEKTAINSVLRSVVSPAPSFGSDLEPHWSVHWSESILNYLQSNVCSFLFANTILPTKTPFFVLWPNAMLPSDERQWMETSTRAHSPTRHPTIRGCLDRYKASTYTLRQCLSLQIMWHDA